jgi:hypothetical protein
MPKRVLPLTDPKCRNAKPSEKQKKLSDGEGLYLLVKPDGSKHWRFDYKRADSGAIRPPIPLQTGPPVPDQTGPGIPL